LLLVERLPAGAAHPQDADTQPSPGERPSPGTEPLRVVAVPRAPADDDVRPAPVPAGEPVPAVPTAAGPGSAPVTGGEAEPADEAEAEPAGSTEPVTARGGLLARVRRARG